jgi:ABC-2 type transport system permease protein
LSSDPASERHFVPDKAAGQQHYLDYFYPGTLVMIILFTAIFTMMSVIEDRNEGFLLSVLVAPVPRAAIVLGKGFGRHDARRRPGIDFSVFSRRSSACTLRSPRSGSSCSPCFWSRLP